MRRKPADRLVAKGDAEYRNGKLYLHDKIEVLNPASYGTQYLTRSEAKVLHALGLAEYEPRAEVSMDNGTTKVVPKECLRMRSDRPEYLEKMKHAWEQRCMAEDQNLTEQAISGWDAIITPERWGEIIRALFHGRYPGLTGPQNKPPVYFPTAR